jgi:hypothetical protein
VALAQEPRYLLPIFPPLLALLAHLIGVIRPPRLWNALLVLLLAAGTLTTVASNSAGLWWNSPERRNDPILSNLTSLIPNDALIIGAEPLELSALLPNRPVRIFGAVDYLGYACSDLVYPAPYSEVAFVLIRQSTDGNFTKPRTDSELDLFFQDWFADCGQVTDIRHSPGAVLVLASLAPR